MLGPKLKAGSICVAALLATAALARAEVIQRGDVRVTVDGSLSPRSLPRQGASPVRVALGFKIASANGGHPSQLRTVTLSVNRFGRFHPGAVPVCRVDDIQPATTQGALESCGDSLVGTGTFRAQILIPQQAPFPSIGKLYAFNGIYDGHPAILAHVYGTEPVPASFTLPFVLTKTKGTFGTTLRASLPDAIGKSAYITGITLDLGKVAPSDGGTASFLTASCPAPKGITVASFPLARANFGFANRNMALTLIRTCKAQGR